MTRARVAVVGAGTMGAEIAEVTALAGLDVVLQSRREGARARFVDRLQRHYRRLAARGRITHAEQMAGLGRVRATAGYEGFSDRELVIEAVAEDALVKAEVLRSIAAVCPAQAVIASTTSSLRIGDLAAGVPAPERVIGLHFFNPVRFVSLVEVVSTPRTAPRCVARALRFVEALGRRPLWVPDGTGFLVNRLLMPVGLEACRAYSEHAATPWEIDQACMHAGMTIGPCATLDLVGLDVALAICRAFERARGDRFRPPALLERCVAAGRLGRKTGRGIFAYPHGRPEPDAALDALRGTLEAEQGIPRPTRFTVERLLLPLRSEARACVAEGLATAEQIDWALGATLGLQTGPFAAEAARQIPLVAAGGGAR